jgi:hypothetical protein
MITNPDRDEPLAGLGVPEDQEHAKVPTEAKIDAAGKQNPVPCIIPPMLEPTTQFRCPTCEAEYKIVRVEAPPTRQIAN